MNEKWHNRTIICVDDEESVRDTYRQILSPGMDDPLDEIFNLAQERGENIDKTNGFEKKFDILLSASGEEAVEIIAAELDNGRRVAAGFFDMRMPGGIDGFETIKRVRRLDPDLICSVVTAYTDHNVDEIRNLFTDEHQDELLYIKKPFTADELDQTALNMVCSWNHKRRLEEHVRAVEKQRRGLKQILHAVSTLSKVPPHSLEHLVSGLLFQFLGMVEGEDGFAVLFSENPSENMHFKIGKFEQTTDMARALERLPDFEKAFKENRVIVDEGRCLIPFLSGDHKLGGMYIESKHPIHRYLDHELLEIFRNHTNNLILNSIYHTEMVAKERESLTDPLTGLYNRRFFIKDLKRN